MHVLVLCGSVSKVSHTRGLMRGLADALHALDCHVEFWDLLLRPMPISIPEFHYNPQDTPDDNVRAFVTQVHVADALAIGTPLYHGSMSGVVKNALDQLASDALRDKPVALLSHGSEERRCAQPCEHLQTVVRTMYGYATQTQIGTTKSDYRREGDAMVVANAEIVTRLARQAKELVRMTAMLSATKASSTSGSDF